MKQIIIIKENVLHIKQLLDKEHCSYEIYQEPLRKFKKTRPEKVNIFSDYGDALKDKELKAEKKLLEEDYEEEEEELEKYENR